MLLKDAQAKVKDCNMFYVSFQLFAEVYMNHAIDEKLAKDILTNYFDPDLPINVKISDGVMYIGKGK